MNEWKIITFRPFSLLWLEIPCHSFYLYLSTFYLPLFYGLWSTGPAQSPGILGRWSLYVLERERERERECLQFCFPQTGRLQFPVSDGSQSFPDKQKLTRTQPAPHPVRHSFMSGNNKTFLRLLTTTSLRWRKKPIHKCPRLSFQAKPVETL